MNAPEDNKPHLKVAVGVVLKNDEVFIAKRPEGKYLAGYWEFPGGKLEKDESVQQALFRELNEELGIGIHSCERFMDIEHDYGEKKVTLLVCLVRDYSGTPKGAEGQEVRWVSRSALNTYRFPEANLQIVKRLLSLSAESYP